MFKMHVEEFRTLRMMYAGRGSPSLQSCENAVQRAEEANNALVLARTLGRLALCQLDVLTEPEEVLQVARRAKTIARRARTAPGVHQLLGLRAEIEALLRLGACPMRSRPEAKSTRGVQKPACPHLAPCRRKRGSTR
jgi:hypothetical protein